MTGGAFPLRSARFPHHCTIFEIQSKQSDAFFRNSGAMRGYARLRIAPELQRIRMARPKLPKIPGGRGAAQVVDKRVPRRYNLAVSIPPGVFAT